MLADFLKGTVDESLKKLVQPAGLVPATVLVLLNLAFIYPAAREQGFAASFAGLGQSWQAAVVGITIVGLGYILLNGANAVIETLAGQTWRGSLFHDLLTQSQKRQQKVLASGESSLSAEERRWALAAGYPPSDKIQATRLGNTLAASQHVIYERYGIDISALWSQTRAIKDLKEAPAMSAVNDEKSTLDLLANLVLVLVLFAVEALTFFALRGEATTALGALLALPAAYVAYRVAVLAARAWGDAVEVVFDLHRKELRAALALDSAVDPSSEHGLWRRANRFFLFGPKTAAPGPAAPTATVTAAPRLKVEKLAATVVNAARESASRAPIDLRRIDYAFVVARIGKADETADADIVVDDGRVRRVRDVPTLPEPENDQPHATVSKLEYEGRTALQWRLTQLGAGGSLVLKYSLPLWRLTASDETPDFTVFARSSWFELRFEDAGNVVLRLESFTLGNREPVVALGETPLECPPAPDAVDTFEVGFVVPVDSPGLFITLPVVSG